MRTVPRRSLLRAHGWWLLALLPVSAMAAPSSLPPVPQVQQIHKCRVAGVATFQRHACAEGQAEQAWEVDAVPAERQHAARIEAIRRELQARKRAQEPQGRAPADPRPRRSTSPRGRTRGPVGAVIALHHQPRMCAKAKRQRDVAYRKAGMSRSFALSRRMDDAVFDACR
ncbi:hypothetical protein [Stenotrophomonas sp. 364]|uniref:hypothetical protein n=1 Tax=Stenotrophomonas sp. 364 TaxID=2691571 RepID=UPI0013169B4D|nr:hypothetical protein [Stenotrophomonas sp. 364]QHB71573.1 hypothetical protein GQ674_09785 [Stenotrophomonas sp. 364]